MKFTDLDELKTPPYSIEAEQSVIGGILLNNNAYGRIAKPLTDGHFYRDDHQLIFRAFADRAADNKPLDVVTVSNYLRNSWQLSSSDWQAMDQGVNKISAMNLLINDASTESSATIRSACYQLMQQVSKPLTALLIDYVQLMQGSRASYPHHSSAMPYPAVAKEVY